MSDYRVTCVTKGAHRARTGGSHGHIISVGVGTGKGWNYQLTVAEVRFAMATRSDRFYTVSPSTKKTALIEPWFCCGVATLRSLPDRVHDNNLDALPICQAG